VVAQLALNHQMKKGQSDAVPSFEDVARTTLPRWPCAGFNKSSSVSRRWSYAITLEKAALNFAMSSAVPIDTRT